MQVYPRDGSARTILRAATLRLSKLSISPCHSILTPGQPVPALSLQHQAPGRVATGVQNFKSLVWLDPEKIPAQAGFEPGIFRSRGGRFNHQANEVIWWRLCQFSLQLWGSWARQGAWVARAYHEVRYVRCAWLHWRLCAICGTGPPR